jgi:hypothetical protein
MILMAEVAISGSGSGDRDGGGGGDDRNSIDWEVEQIRGMDGEEIMLVVVELGMGVTAEDI